MVVFCQVGTAATAYITVWQNMGTPVICVHACRRMAQHLSFAHRVVAHVQFQARKVGPSLSSASCAGRGSIRACPLAKQYVACVTANCSSVNSKGTLSRQHRGYTMPEYPAGQSIGTRDVALGGRSFQCSLRTLSVLNGSKAFGQMLVQGAATAVPGAAPRLTPRDACWRRSWLQGCRERCRPAGWGGRLQARPWPRPSPEHPGRRMHPASPSAEVTELLLCAQQAFTRSGESLAYVISCGTLLPCTRKGKAHNHH